ncbi:MAG: hypothetical protein ABIJ92_03520 [Candidatus Aenigmatarchaeota archaeon]
MEEETLTKDQLKAIQDQLFEIKDLQIVNKLDIINLKNSLENVRLSSSTITPETEDKMKEMLEITKKLDKFKKLDDLVNDINILKKNNFSDSGGYKATKGFSSLDSKVNEIEHTVSILETKLASMRPVRVPENMKDLDKYAGMMGEMIDKIGSLEAQIEEFMELKNAMQDKMKDVKSVPKGAIKVGDIYGLEEFIYEKFREISNLLKDDVKKNAEQLKDLDSKINKIKIGTGNTEDLEKLLSKLDIDKVMREFESVKTKMEWIEDKLDKLNLRTVMERLDEIEHKQRVSNASSALVIE